VRGILYGLPTGIGSFRMGYGESFSANLIVSVVRLTPPKGLATHEHDC